MFALTPRAGRWNHRFLVPSGSRWSQQALSKLVEAAKESRQPSIISTNRSVVQATTGRTGEELLILKDERLTRLSTTARELIQKRVDDHAECLETIVTQTIDWDAMGSDLVIERTELSEWLQGADGLIETISRDDAMPSEIDRTRSPYMISILVLLGLCATGAVLWQMARISEQPQPPKTKVDLPLTDANRSEMAELLGVDSSNKPRADVERNIQEILGSLFVEASIGAHRHRDDTAGDDKVGRTHLSIEKSLELLYQVHFPDQRASVPKDLVSHNRGTLNKLFPADTQHSLDPLGLLPPDHRMVDQLEGIAPSAFRQIGNSLAKIHALGSQPVPEDTLYGKFFADIFAMDVDLFRQSLETSELQTPRFFLDEDAKLAQAIESLFKKDSLAKLLGRDIDNRQRPLVEMMKRIGEEHSKEVELLSATGIKIAQKNHQGNKDAIRAFELLNQMVEACQHAVVDSATDRAHDKPRE